VASDTLKSRSEMVLSVLTGYFGLDPEKDLIHFEVIFPGFIKGDYERVKLEYENNLKTHPRRKEVSRNLYVSDECIVHVQYCAPLSVVSEIKVESRCYFPVCTIDEIKRIENVSNGEDYLLKIRADAIADSPRFSRVFMKRRERVGDQWTLSSHFQKSDFDRYLDRLPSGRSEICREVSAGFAFMAEPNGVCIKTEVGKVVVVSEALRHFLFYMNLFLFGSGLGLSGEVVGHSLVIALKTMLQTEPLDFDLDPRSELLPVRVKSYCLRVVQDQIDFVIGHEYSHVLLNHFGEKAELRDAVEILGVRALSEQKYYSPREEQEFEADAASIINPSYSDDECARILNGAAFFFLQLDFFYAVANYINPPTSGARTHPDPLDRMWKLRGEVDSLRPIKSDILYSESDLNDWVEYVDRHKRHFLEEYLPFNVEVLEQYGSTYIPSYRKKHRHDRFDY